ncbi:GNAT family N-acetyltransferase [Natronoglycomyces albus]|uniref:GNAT family N-acetyltransferase n=1 Tax=Natronoglycomyces albus TaxID=2811108 RepID=A0A895XNZ6_9ACTN|nr:GNAT family N-acetyltransferase [Natronoglycomyces albus]QSB04226.1 GNAT family N-acetyltransferase [Natronoglycomyces albus]
MHIRDAHAEDWPHMWAFMRPVIEAGETYPYERDRAENVVREFWMNDSSPRATLVSVTDDGAITGTAEIHPNQPGQGAHIANAGFIVNAAYTGQGVGRALGNAVLERARSEGYHAMQFNAVVETNSHAVALWHSLGFRTLAVVPDGFNHPTHGLVGMHIMYQKLTSSPEDA